MCQIFALFFYLALKKMCPVFAPMPSHIQTYVLRITYIPKCEINMHRRIETRYTASTQLLLVTTSVKYIYFYYSTIYTLYNWNEWICWCVRLARKAFDWCKQRSFQILSMQSANTFLHSEIDTGRRSNNALCNINSEFAVSQRINIRILCGIQVRKNIVRCL